MNEKRNEIIFKLINKGFTYEKAGLLFGLSKQSVYSINKNFIKNNVLKPIICVNCGFETYSDIDISSEHFVFGNDPINICLICAQALIKYDKLKNDC